jgi:putative transposase
MNAIAASRLTWLGSRLRFAASRLTWLGQLNLVRSAIVGGSLVVPSMLPPLKPPASCRQFRHPTARQTLRGSRRFTVGAGVAMCCPMTWPRRVIPGASYLITRRVNQRTFRMRPHVVTNQISQYCAAVAAQKTNVIIHAFVVMSNHHHLVVTDPLGVLPEFLRELHRLTAKALNASQGLWDNLWSAEKASAVRLPTLRDVLDKIAYCAANPVTAALVDAPDKWPGVNLWLPGSIRRITRPTAYFAPRGNMPDAVELRCEPPGTMSEGLEEWRGRVREAVSEAVTQARQFIAARGLAFLGASAVMKKSFLLRAKTYEQRRTLNPVFAARDVAVRRSFVRIEKAFRAAYRLALDCWREGERKVLFPFGTWWMVVHHHAELSPVPA